MAEIELLTPGCEDDDRGKRGKRGHRGPTGPTGSTGSAGPSFGALIGRQVFDVAGPFTYTPTPGTTKAIVRGAGGGGGGGGVGGTSGGSSSVASGGNSGTAVEIEISAAAGQLLTGGPGTVGSGGAGGVGNTNGTNGGNSTIVVGGTTVTAPGGVGGNTSPASTIAEIVPPNAQPAAIGVNYSAAELGGNGIAILPAAGEALAGGNGGSGDYGIGGLGGNDGAAGGAAGGNGAGGGGASQGTSGGPLNGGNATPGIWIIEEYS